jgi:hypothetical protein
MAGTLILPKVRKSDGMVVSTSIDTDMIKGCEPKQVMVNHKSYSGSKIYTANGQSFYALVAPMMLNAAKQVAGSKNTMIAVDAVKEFPSYTAEVKQLLMMTEKLAL